MLTLSGSMHIGGMIARSGYGGSSMFSSLRLLGRMGSERQKIQNRRHQQNLKSLHSSKIRHSHCAKPTGSIKVSNRL